MAGVNHLASLLGKTSILSVTIPEIKKRRVPNKFYVYKIIVQWSNGQNITVYRRYSNFFDFWCKLKELHTSLLNKSIRYAENPVPLPEMPGKIFLGRSQIHQVAQKRQKKLEEFCQQLVKMPVEVSQSTVVYGFFSLWPDDSISAMEVRRNTATGHKVIKPDMTSSVHIPPPSADPFQHPLLSARSTTIVGASASEFDGPEGLSGMPLLRKTRAETIDVADFMEEEREADPQYRAISDYSRLDAQQLDLREGQVVRVIEKHDTGWWMVEASFEQGYVPASHLEPLDDKEKTANQEDALADSDEYIALEKFDSRADDELSLSLGDIVTVVSIKLDGWWKIRKGSEVGYAPSAILRKKGMEEIAKTLTRESQIFLNDVTLLRSSRRFPPRHYSASSASRGGVRVQPKTSPAIAVDKDGRSVACTGPAVPRYNIPNGNSGQGLSRGFEYRFDSPYDIPKGCSGLPAGIERRYEWCKPNREAPQNHYKMDTREEPACDSADAPVQPVVDLSIYQVPSSISVNSNLSNNQDHAESGSAQATSYKVDIYSNLDFSPPPGVKVQQALDEQQVDASIATTTERPSPKALRAPSSSSSIDESISTVDPELMAALNEEEMSRVPSRGDDEEQTVTAERRGQSPLVLPPRIPRSHTASPAVQEHCRPTPVSGVRKPPPPPPPPPTKPHGLYEAHTLAKLRGQLRQEAGHGPLVKKQSDLAATGPSVQNRPLPSPPSEKKPPLHPRPGVASHSPTWISRPPPPPPPYHKKQPASTEKSSFNQGTVDDKSLPDLPGKTPLATATSVKGRPLPSPPRQGHPETGAVRARPLPELPPSGDIALPPRVPRVPTEGTVCERSDTVPINFTNGNNEYWTMYSASRTLQRDSIASADNEYVDMDDESLLLQATPDSTTDVVDDIVEVGSVQNQPNEGPLSLEAKPFPSPRMEGNGIQPPTSRVLSTEPLDDSIASRNIPEQTPPPSQDRVPSPLTPPDFVSEDPDDAVPLSQVEYLNVTSDMLDVGNGQLYQNVTHPESEYKNFTFVPPRKPTSHLGTYIATTSADQTMEECIRVKAHDRGELLAESKEWWYMRIGREEGWTPKEIWEPTVETKALLKSGVLGQCLSKKRSFTAADGVKPKAPPPKPRRVFEHIQETPEETQDRIRASTAVDRRHKRSSPSRTTDLHHNRTTSPSNGATSPSNLMAPPTATAATPTNQSEMTKFQQRPLPEPPVEMQTGQYVCDVSLPLDLQPWFYKAMDRPEAEKLLRMAHVRNREFLVRERPRKPGYYALSVRHHYSIRHFNIDPNSDGSYSIGQHSFDSLPDIILHYQTHSLFMEGSGGNQAPVTIVRPAKLLRMAERQRSNTSLQ